MSHPLDNVVYDAVGGAHAHFGLAAAGARRYLPEISPLCGVARASDPACWRALATLVPPGTRGGALLWQVVDTAPLTLIGTHDLVQMAWTASVPPPVEEVACRRLGAADADAMLELVRLTEPGPMERRTHELGTYLGVHDETGRLIAMSGERTRVPGFTEVSAVCTHPDHRGKGLARKLMALLMRDIVARGERPYLHVAAGNAAAIALYEKLGFEVRRRGYLLRFSNG